MWSCVQHLSLPVCVYRFKFDYIFIYLFGFLFFSFLFFSFFFFLVVICAFVVVAPCFKWKNKWIIISRPPERPISCAVGTVVHFTVRIFYETMCTVVGAVFFLILPRLLLFVISLDWFGLFWFGSCFFLSCAFFFRCSNISQSAFFSKDGMPYSRINNEWYKMETPANTKPQGEKQILWLYINVF